MLIFIDDRVECVYDQWIKVNPGDKGRVDKIWKNGYTVAFDNGIKLFAKDNQVKKIPD